MRLICRASNASAATRKIGLEMSGTMPTATPAQQSKEKYLEGEGFLSANFPPNQLPNVR